MIAILAISAALHGASVLPPATDRTVGVIQSAAQLINPGYLAMMDRCAADPETAARPDRSDWLLNTVAAGTDKTASPASIVVATFGRCLEKLEKDLGDPTVLSAIKMPDAAPYLADLAKRRKALTANVPLALSRIDPQPMARAYVAACKVETILDKGGGDFDAEDEASANGHYSQDVAVGNYASIVQNHCYDEFVTLLGRFPSTPAIKGALQILRDSGGDVKGRVRRWMKANGRI